MQHDSTLVLIKGDTIYKEKIILKDRYKYIYKTKNDTIIKTDSIIVQRIVKETKNKSITQRITNFCGAVISLAFIIAILVWIANKLFIK